MHLTDLLVPVASGLVSAGLIAAFFHWLAGRNLKSEAARLRIETEQVRMETKELRKESEGLRNLSTLILRALEDAGFAKLNRDENGEPIGLVFDLHI